MTKRTLFAGGASAPFAHLFGGRAGKAAKPGRAEDEKEDKDAAAAEDDDDEKKDASKAEDPDDPPEEDKVAETEDDEKDAKKAKRKAKADDDEDETCAEEDSDDDEVASAAAAGRRAERARCAKIFGSEAAGARPDVAAQLAFTTNMSSAEAIGVLNAVAAGHAAPAKASALHERMARVRQPDTGSDAPGAAEKPTGAKAAAASILAAVEKARPKKAS